MKLRGRSSSTPAQPSVALSLRAAFRHLHSSRYTVTDQLDQTLTLCGQGVNVNGYYGPRIYAALGVKGHHLLLVNSLCKYPGDSLSQLITELLPQMQLSVQLRMPSRKLHHPYELGPPLTLSLHRITVLLDRVGRKIPLVGPLPSRSFMQSSNSRLLDSWVKLNPQHDDLN